MVQRPGDEPGVAGLPGELQAFLEKRAGLFGISSPTIANQEIKACVLQAEGDQPGIAGLPGEPQTLTELVASMCEPMQTLSELVA